MLLYVHEGDMIVGVFVTRMCACAHVPESRINILEESSYM